MVSLTKLLLLAQGALGLSLEAPFKDDAGWQILGDAQISETALNLVHGKNQKGSVWTKKPVTDAEFTLEAVLKFSADLKTPAGKSGLALWYTDKPLPPGDLHGSADSWTGLAVMVDSLMPEGTGSVRGHLNDGSYKYSSLKDVGKESLSLCMIDYRNAKGPITVRVGYSEDDGFVVDVNGQKCFMSRDIVLPPGYYFGISANSDATTDTLSFEKISFTRGFNKDVAKHLPQNAPKLDAKADTKVDAKVDAKVDSKADAKADTKVDTKADSKADSKTDVKAKPGLTQPDFVGATLEDIERIIAPLQGRLELAEMRLGQVKSSVDQLVESLSLSLSQVTERGGKADSSKELAGVQKEVQNLRGLVSDMHQSSTSSSTTTTTPVNGGTSIWVVLGLLVPTQLLAVWSYHAYLRRQERHQKLL